MNVRFTFLSSILIFMTFSSTAQKINWEKNYGGSFSDFGRAIQQTHDGGYVVAGYTNSNNGDISNLKGSWDYWIVKLDPTGLLEWEKTFGGSEEDFAYAIVNTSDGGYMVGGTSKSSDWDVSENHGQDDVWLIKLDSSGNEVGQVNYGGSGDDELNALQQTNDNGYILACNSSSSDFDVSGNLGSVDYWIVKINAGGDIQWEKNFGGSREDIPMSIQQTNDGGYIVAGETTSDDGNVSVNKGFSDVWIIKLDASGNEEWEISYGGSNSDIPSSIQQTLDDGYIVGATTLSDDMDVSDNYTPEDDPAQEDIWILKLDSSGKLEWERNYGGSQQEGDIQIIQTPDGGYILGSSSISNDMDVSGNYDKLDIWIAKLDNEGTILWNKNYGGSDYDFFESIQQINDRSYVILGNTYSSDKDVSDNHGWSDYWILNICNQARSEIEETFCESYTVPSGDETYTTPGIYTDTLTALHGCDSVITIHLTNEDVLDTAVYQEGNVLQAAQFDAFYQWGRCGENGFEPIAGATDQTYTATEDGDYAVVLMKGGCRDTTRCYTVNFSTGVHTAELSHLHVYPNPAADEITIHLGNNYNSARVEISSLSGRKLIARTLDAPVSEIDLSLDFPAGFYILTIYQDGMNRSFKLQKRN